MPIEWNKAPIPKQTTQPTAWKAPPKPVLLEQRPKPEPKWVPRHQWSAVLYGRRSFYEVESERFPMRLRDNDTVMRWDIRPMDFIMCAADFYLLERLASRPDLGDRIDLMVAWNGLRSFLRRNFAAYTDMVIGGEIRHATPAVRKRKAIAPPLRRLLNVWNGIPSSRHEAWDKWYFLKLRYGKMLTAWCAAAYNTTGWRSAFGGLKWGTIARTLFMYEHGDISDTQFIDTCWSLQHNTGIYFNKIWGGDWSALKRLLNAQHKGDTAYLLEHASLSVSTMWEKYTRLPDYNRVDRWYDVQTRRMMVGRKGRDGD